MQRRDFTYELPAGLIAQFPSPTRSRSRMLHLDCATGLLADRVVADLPDLLAPGDLLVCNDTRVIPARLLGRKASGGQVEILVERVLDESRVLAQARASKPLRAGIAIALADGIEAEVEGRDPRGLWRLRFCGAPAADVLATLGRVPLPPYITREPQALDAERYQTVFARHPGAVAAPTASLHFDPPLLARLRERGVDLGCTTLHVGAGTFAPVRSERVEDHRMHAERYAVDARLCAQVAATRARGGRVVAVGTTVVRALESAARGDTLAPAAGETDIFIHPGHRFRAVDVLLTNFHVPESTLLMLVCAFAGRSRVLAAYRHAVAQEYRFFSYGDAMLVTGGPVPPGLAAA